MNTNTFTLTEAQKRKINSLQGAYLQAKTLDDMLIEKMTKIKTKVLAEGNYLICDDMLEMRKKRGITDRRITNPKSDYLMDEDIFLNDYLVKCYELEQAAGIANTKGKEYCANAEAHELMLETEKQLVDIAIEILPFPEEKKTLEQFKTHWKYRPQILDLILKLDCGKIEL